MLYWHSKLTIKNKRKQRTGHVADGEGYAESAVIFKGKFEITDDIQCIQW